MWMIWIITAVFLLIAEIFTSGFALACFAIGCLAGIIADLVGLSINGQLIAFIIGTILTFIFIRPVILKTLSKKAIKKGVLTNMDALIGQCATVSETITANNGGRIKINGDEWQAVSTDNTQIEIGEKVIICSYNSNLLTIKKQLI